MDNVYESVATTEDLYSFYKEIDLCISNLFQVDTSIDDALDKAFNLQEKEAILKYLEENKVDMKNQGQIEEALQVIKKAGKTFPIVTLKLGYDPSRQHLETFSTWFLKRIGKKVILEILVERSLLGGVYITYNGYFKDYSLKKKLQYVFKDEDFTKRKKTTAQS